MRDQGRGEGKEENAKFVLFKGGAADIWEGLRLFRKWKYNLEVLHTQRI